MSYITTFYDALYSEMVTLFPTKTEILDPYDQERSDDKAFINGFGIAINEANNPNDFGTGLRTFDRDVEIILTRQFISTKQDTGPRKTNEKLLLEDQKTMIEGILTNGVIKSSIYNIDLLDDRGIEFIFTEKDNFLMLRTRFIAKFQYDIFC